MCVCVCVPLPLTTQRGRFTWDIATSSDWLRDFSPTTAEENPSLWTQLLFSNCQQTNDTQTHKHMHNPDWHPTLSSLSHPLLSDIKQELLFSSWVTYYWCYMINNLWAHGKKKSPLWSLTGLWRTKQTNLIWAEVQKVNFRLFYFIKEL